MAQFAIGSDGAVYVTGASAGLFYSDFATVKYSPADSDADGVPDSRDQCPDTHPGEIVNGDGCSISQLVPCGGPWKNHGQYVSSMTHMAGEFLKAGLITREQKDAIVSAAARSGCGKNR